MFLYEIKNLSDGKIYVGITNNIARRWKEHRSELRANRHGNCHLQAAWNLYGESIFQFTVINEFNDLEELNKAEIEFINRYDLNNPSKGYNLANGGAGHVHTQEARDKIAEAQLIPIVRMDIKTKEIKFYNSMKDTEKDGFNAKNIGNACCLRSLTHKNSVWMYVSEYSNNPDELLRRVEAFTNVKARPSRYRPIVGKNIKTNEIIKLDSTYHSKDLGFNHQIVYACCKNKVKLHKDFVWCYLEDREQLDNKIKIAHSRKTRKV